MPWKYSNVEPSAYPECPWCHKPDGVHRTAGRDGYECRGCNTKFTATYEPDQKISNLDWAKHDRQPPKTSKDAWT